MRQLRQHRRSLLGLRLPSHASSAERFLALARANEHADEELGPPARVCRSSEAKEPIEWQADYFAAALLMPRNRVRAAWEQWQGAATPVSGTRLWAEVDGLILADWFRYGTDPETIEDGLMESFCQPLAERFQVSAPAMRIRLEELELLTRSSCSIGR